MVENTVILNGQSNCLEIDVSETGWARVYLLEKGKKIALGAETISSLIEQLLSALQGENDRYAGEINGKTVNCVCSLSEEHGTIYFVEEDFGIVFFTQDKFANQIAYIEITHKQRTIWEGQLKELKETIK
jgi:hypothetical protein